MTHITHHKHLWRVARVSGVVIDTKELSIVGVKIDRRTDHFDAARTQAHRFARQLAAKHVYDRAQMWQHCRAVGHIAKEQRVDVGSGQGTIVVFRDGSRMYKARSSPDTRWRVINYG